MTKKVAEQALEYAKLKTEKESQEKDSTQNHKRLKGLLDQETREKDAEKVPRIKLEDLTESYKEELDLNKTIREELLRLKKREEETSLKHHEETLSRGKETVKTQLENETLSTKAYDLNLALKVAEARVTETEEKTEMAVAAAEETKKKCLKEKKATMK